MSENTAKYYNGRVRYDTNGYGPIRQDTRPRHYHWTKGDTIALLIGLTLFITAIVYLFH